MFAIFAGNDEEDDGEVLRVFADFERERGFFAPLRSASAPMLPLPVDNEDCGDAAWVEGTLLAAAAVVGG